MARKPSSKTPRKPRAPTSPDPGPTPAFRAQDLVYDAWEARPAQQLGLALEALRLWPDCADAYIVLAQLTEDLVAATAFCWMGVWAGERAIGPEVFAQEAGHFYGILETRPYMRARWQLAMCLWDGDAHAAAVEHARELLRLNEGDNIGIRYMLAGWLLALGDDAQVAELLARFPDDGDVYWLYAKALMAFRRGGDTDVARALLGRALTANPFVPAYLLGTKQLPEELPPYTSFGDETEAMSSASMYQDGWARTKGALAWLRKRATAAAPKLTATAPRSRRPPRSPGRAARGR